MPLAIGSNFVRGRLADCGHAARNLDRLNCAGNRNQPAGWRARRHQRFDLRRSAAVVVTRSIR